MNIEKNNPSSSQGPNVASLMTYQENKAIREIGLSKVKSIPHCETNQCHGFLIEASMFYESPSCVTCFLVGTLPCVYHSRKNP